MSKNFLTEAYKKLRQRLQHEDSYKEEDALNDAFCQLWCSPYNPATTLEGEKLLSVATHRRQKVCGEKRRGILIHPLIKSASPCHHPTQMGRKRFFK